MQRRTFMKTASAAAIAAGAIGQTASAAPFKEEFKISVATWSFHKMTFAGEVTQLDHPRLAVEAGGQGVELVNQFFPSPTDSYCKELSKRAADVGIPILLIMCDSEGDMSNPDFKVRRQAVINHRKWADIAAVLGCHSIRCNSGGENVSPEEDMKASAASFYELSQYARQYGLNVIVENHWSRTADPKWLVGLVEMVGEDNFGTLPDFGNFPKEVDKYEAVKMLMPFARAVSAKCYDFGPDGNETTIDYEKMLRIVFDAGYHKYIGVEFEGNRMSEKDGTKACVDLLKRYQK
ncbi:MAG: TIM barrel protein [bacterium]|nr:TIM barrel protein [bacterium]